MKKIIILIVIIVVVWLGFKWFSQNQGGPKEMTENSNVFPSAEEEATVPADSGQVPGIAE